MMTEETLQRAREYVDSLSQPLKGIVGIHMSLDNFEWHDKRHAEFWGHAVMTTTADQSTPVLVIWTDGELGKVSVTGIVLVVDDGSTTVPYYYTGGQPNDRAAWFQPYPTNPDGRTRPDGQRIDFRRWMLGPSRSYHVKISYRIPALDATPEYKVSHD